MKALRGALVLLAVFIAPVVAKEAPAKPLWLAVGAKELTASLKPLAEHRAKEFEVRIAEPPIAEAIKNAGRTPSVLLLVGDYEPGKDGEVWQLPPMTRKLYKWRKPQREQFSSDSLYGDTDGDLVPDFPVGRFPARTPEEVKLFVAKTLAYEARKTAPEDLRLIVWAGAPGYGGTVDAMATGMLVSTVRRYAPAWADRFLISGDANSPLCGWPPNQVTTFNVEWRRGSILTAFVAHASDRAVYSMNHEKQGIWYSRLSAQALTGDVPASPVVFLTCYSGEFDDDNECLAETLLKAPGGPPAAIAATTESHPLTNLFTGRAMLKALAAGERRLGDMWVRTQREGAKMRDFLMENMLKDVEGKLEEKIDIAKLQRDQPLLFAILGDPALRLLMPTEFEVEVIEPKAGPKRYRVPKELFPNAVSLVVGYRPDPGRAEKKAPPNGADEAMERLGAANAKESFRVIRTAGRDEEWTGDFAEPGTYRFLLTTKSGVAAAAVRIR